METTPQEVLKRAREGYLNNAKWCLEQVKYKRKALDDLLVQATEAVCKARELEIALDRLGYGQ